MEITARVSKGGLGQEDKVFKAIPRSRSSFHKSNVPWVNIEHNKISIQLNHHQLKDLFEFCIEVYGTDQLVAILSGEEVRGDYLTSI